MRPNLTRQPRARRGNAAGRGQGADRVHDIGIGLCAVIAISDLPQVPVAGDPNTTASVCNVTANARGQIPAPIAEPAVATVIDLHNGCTADLAWQ
jgi:hypothetical protein